MRKTAVSPNFMAISQAFYHQNLIFWVKFFF